MNYAYGTFSDGHSTNGFYLIGILITKHPFLFGTRTEVLETLLEIKRIFDMTRTDTDNSFKITAVFLLVF